MSLYVKLIFREATVHWVRLLLALLAIIATSCMVVWLIGSFDQLAADKRDSAENYLGSYQLVLSPPAGMEGGRGKPGMGPGGPGEGKPGIGPGGPGEGKPGIGPGGPGEGKPGMGLGGRRGANPLNPQVLGLLRNDESVETVDAAMQCFGVQSAIADDKFSVYDRIRQGMGTPMGSAMIVGINTTTSPFPLQEGRWFNTVITGYPKATTEMLECVIGSSAMRQMRPINTSSSGDQNKGAELGSVVQFYFNGVEVKAHIVGVFEQGLSGSSMPRRSAPGGDSRASLKPVQITQGAIYLPLGAAAKTADCAPRTDLVYIRLKQGTDVNQFRQKYEKIFKEKGWTLLFQDIDDVRAALVGNQSAGSILQQAYASIGLALVASIFIIFTTLSMGVNERTRQLALLRCIGLSRFQIAVLILGESLLLGVFGCIGGIFAGYGLLLAGQIINGHKAVVALSVLCVGVTVVCSLLGALLASIIPAWRAARIKPMDALEQAQAIPSNKWAIPSAIVGLVLTSIGPIIVYGNIVSTPMAKTIYGAAGLVFMSIGFLLLIPALIILAERLFTPVAAAIFGIPSLFLHGQLTRSLWRSAGTVISISIGLGLYCFFEIWGYSMLVPFTPTHDMPDALVAFFPQGLPDADVIKVKSCPAVDADRFLPLQVEHAKFTREQQIKLDPSVADVKPGQRPTGSLGMNDNMVIMGVDVDKAFGGVNPMLKIPFDEGNLADAIEKLKSEKRYCLVIDVFAKPLNLHVGDTLEFDIPDPNSGRGTFAGLPKTIGTAALTGIDDPGQATAKAGESLPKTVQFEIAGILKFTGYQWLVKTSGLRFRQGRGGLVFCRDTMVWDSFRTPQEDRNRFFWFDQQKGKELDYNALNYAMTQIAENATSTPTTAEPATAATAATAETSAPQASAPSASGSSQAQIAAGKGFAKVSTIESLNEFLNRRADSVIQSMAKMPLMILIITTIAVVNTMVASVRTRRWEIGLLRAVSLTRFQTVRLIFAESLLLALVASFVSFSLGTMAAWRSIGVSSTGAFGALNVPLTFPWYHLGYGFALTLGLCLAAAVWTALSAAREEPARLLASDR